MKVKMERRFSEDYNDLVHTRLCLQGHKKHIGVTSILSLLKV